MKRFDILTVERESGRVVSVPVKDVGRERAENWRESMAARTGAHLRLVVERAGVYAEGESWDGDEEEE